MNSFSNTTADTYFKRIKCVRERGGVRVMCVREGAFGDDPVDGALAELP